MSIQAIINRAESIQFNRRRVIGIQYSKSQIAYTTETVTRNPWQFKIKISAALPYDDVTTRNILETVDYRDRNHAETVSLANVPGMSWMMKYKGELTTLQQSQLTVHSFAGNQLTLNLPGSGSVNAVGTVLFRVGDFIQIKSLNGAGQELHPWPFTVLGPAGTSLTNDTPSDVLLTSGMISSGKVTITVHRNNFIVGSVTGANVNIGNQCKFRMTCPNMPTYTVIAGGASALVTFDSDFDLFEATADIIIGEVPT
jgi:hypothetical protein